MLHDEYRRNPVLFISSCFAGIKAMHRLALPKLFAIDIHDTEFAVKGSAGIEVPYVEALHRLCYIIVKRWCVAYINFADQF